MRDGASVVFVSVDTLRRLNGYWTQALAAVFLPTVNLELARDLERHESVLIRDGIREIACARFGRCTLVLTGSISANTISRSSWGWRIALSGPTISFKFSRLRDTDSRQRIIVIPFWPPSGASPLSHLESTDSSATGAALCHVNPPPAGHYRQTPHHSGTAHSNGTRVLALATASRREDVWSSLQLSVHSRILGSPLYK